MSRERGSARAILNCGGDAGTPVVRFIFECPMTWDALEPTDDPNHRRCADCARDVFWCHNAIDAGLRAEQGECIAVPSWLVDGVREEEAAHNRRITIGQVAPPRALFERAVARRMSGDPPEDP